MGLFDKVKNLFTEEVEEEKPIRKEVRHVEVAPPKREDKMEIIKKEESELEKEKFVFFDDKDFEDLEKRENLKIEKEEKKNDIKLPYKGNKPIVSVPTVEKKKFTPSPIISPVYGVLDKNYKKEDVTVKHVRTLNKSKNLTVDDVRNLAFATIEDDLKNDLLASDYDLEKKELPVDDLEIFGDLDKEESIKKENDDKIIEELDDYDLDEDTEILARKLKEQQKKLDEINDIINDESPKKTRPSLDEILDKLEKNNSNEKNLDDESKNEQLEVIKEEINSEEIKEEQEEISTSIDEVFTETLDDLDQAISSNDSKEESTKKSNNKDLTDSELLNLIDTMYEKRDEE